MTIAEYEVIPAGDEEDALRRAREHRAALILLEPTTMKRLFFPQDTKLNARNRREQAWVLKKSLRLAGGIRQKHVRRK